MGAYKKEVWFTIVMSIAFLLSGHMGLLFSMFPVEGTLFGFPITYIVPILFGWFGVLALTIIAGKLGNHIDESIEKESLLEQSSSKKQSKEGVS